MESYEDLQRKNYCCGFTIEQSAKFVAWTSLVFGFFYVIGENLFKGWKIHKIKENFFKIENQMCDLES